MTRRWVFLLSLLLPVVASAQLLTITSTKIQDSSGLKLASGVTCWSPVTNAGAPMAFQNSGLNTAASVCRDVINGVIQATYKGTTIGTMKVADTTLTNPLNACYKVYVKDNATGAVVVGSPKTGGFDCVQPQTTNYWCSAGTCNFDNYVPTGTPGVVMTTGPTGAPGATGATGAAGATGAPGGAAPTVTNLAGLPADGAGSEGALYKLTDAWKGLGIYANGHARPFDVERDVRDFGARGDGGTYSQVVCSNGSGTITTVGLVAGRLPKVGDNIVISGCGAAGADLSAVVSGGTATTGTLFGTVTLGGGVTASATLTNRGARWGASTDDTTAFAAAITACSTAAQTNGCKIRVPTGVFFVSNVVYPLIAAAAQGQIMFVGVGQRSSWIVGIGADHSAIFRVPSGGVSSYFADLGFTNYDYHQATQIPAKWEGGLNHTFINNYVTGTYEMVNATGVQDNLIAFNTCYVTISHCIEFGSGVAGDFVTDTKVIGNNFQSWGNAGSDSTAHGYYAHTADTSYENYIAWNACQFDNGTPGECYDTTVNYEDIYLGYTEGVTTVSGYTAIFRGQGQVVHAAILGCVRFTGLNQVLYANSPTQNCPAQTYAIKNDGTALQVYGLSPVGLSATGSNNSVYGLNMIAGGGAIKATANSPASAADWPNGGRVDIASTPFGRSNFASANPTSPNQFGTAASIPTGTIVARNASLQLGFYTGNEALLCTNGSGCATNPVVATDWSRIWEVYTKVHTENSGINSTAVPWTIGDGYWDKTPNGSGIFYWAVTAAGSPGTHRPVQIHGGQSVVTFSATPTFDVSLGTTFKITLTANVTSSTLSNAFAGQTLVFQICQDGTGSRTFVWPTNVKGADTVGSTLSTCTVQEFVYDGTNAYAVAAAKTNM